MDNIPNDIIPIIFNFITLITDKRQFLRTCKRINNITKKLMVKYENNFEVEYFPKIETYCVEKFTLELYNDKYFRLMPMSYINVNNNIIVDTLVMSGNIELLKISANNGCDLRNENRFVNIHHMDNQYDYERFFSIIFGNKCNIRQIADIFSLAAHYGHLNILEFLVYQGCKPIWISALMAAKNGQLDTLKWLKTNNCEFTHYVSAIASLYGHYDVIKWLIQIDCISHLASKFAGRKGYVNILELLKENKCKISSKVGSEAAGNGHINVLEWLRKNNYIINDDINNLAAAFGHLNVLIWLKENGFKGNNTSCVEAAYDGNLNTIKWLIENGYELDRYQVFEVAISYDFFHIFEWLINNGYEIDKHEICDMALSYQNTIIIEWLAKNNYKWNEENINSVNDLTENNHKETLNWAKSIQYMINK